MIIAIPTNNGDTYKEVPVRKQNASYCKHVENAGFDPILIPMECSIEAVTDMSDGLLLAGGLDISPMYYGFSNLASFGVDPDKDAHERALLHAFIALGKPVFGICRGHQLILREFMHVTNDMDNILEYEEHIKYHAQTGELNMGRKHPSHMTQTVINSLFTESIVDNDEAIENFPVNSMHHQAVTANIVKMAVGNGNVPHDFQYNIPPVKVYENFELISWTKRGYTQPDVHSKNFDRTDHRVVVEAMKIDWNNSKIMGVQWHPECLGDVRIIRNFFLNAVENINDDAAIAALG
jgi:gamma-glutamyl-gamma-aminobutyrate hydrolase PuuD